MPIKIRLHGTEYWFLGESFEEDGAIAPLEHCDDDGDMALSLYGALTTDSYAHWVSGVGVMRYREVIAQLEDIEIVQQNARSE